MVGENSREAVGDVIGEIAVGEAADEARGAAGGTGGPDPAAGGASPDTAVGEDSGRVGAICSEPQRVGAICSEPHDVVGEHTVGDDSRGTVRRAFGETVGGAERLLGRDTGEAVNDDGLSGGAAAAGGVEAAGVTCASCPAIWSASGSAN